MRRFDDVARKPALGGDFPTFLEGLSLRQNLRGLLGHYRVPFPFLLGRAFIEAYTMSQERITPTEFPFLLGRAFIEAMRPSSESMRKCFYFPSFWEGLSLRPCTCHPRPCNIAAISLPFRRGFH